MMFIIFWIFFPTYKLYWILNFSSFLKYLATTLQANIFIFPSFDLESLRAEIALFPKPCKLK